MNPFDQKVSRRSKASASGARSAAVRGAAAREKRARDHLEKKRRRERLRLARERGREEAAERNAFRLTVLSPIVLFAALVLGMASAGPLAEGFGMRRNPLETIAVQGATTLTPGAIATQTGLAPGEPLESVDPEQVREALAEQPWIASSRVRRLPNGTLLVGVHEREAIARFLRPGEDAPSLVEPDGARFPGSLAEAGPLPLVRGETAGDQPIPVEALEILGAVWRHAALAGDPSALTLHLPGAPTNADDESAGRETGYVLQIGEAGPRALLGRRLLSQRVARLAALLDSEEATARSAHLIDLRYADRAVLQTEERPASG